MFHVEHKAHCILQVSHIPLQSNIRLMVCSDNFKNISQFLRICTQFLSILFHEDHTPLLFKAYPVNVTYIPIVLQDSNNGITIKRDNLAPLKVES